MVKEGMNNKKRMRMRRGAAEKFRHFSNFSVNPLRSDRLEKIRRCKSVRRSTTHETFGWSWVFAVARRCQMFGIDVVLHRQRCNSAERIFSRRSDRLVQRRSLSLFCPHLPGRSFASSNRWLWNTRCFVFIDEKTFEIRSTVRQFVLRAWNTASLRSIWTCFIWTRDNWFNLMLIFPLRHFRVQVSNQGVR